MAMSGWLLCLAARYTLLTSPGPTEVWDGLHWRYSGADRSGLSASGGLAREAKPARGLEKDTYNNQYQRKEA